MTRLKSERRSANESKNVSQDIDIDIDQDEPGEETFDQEQNDRDKSHKNNTSRINQIKRLRRTLTFLNINRKRAAHYCTLNALKRNHRRLSLSTNHIANKLKTSRKLLNNIQNTDNNVIIVNKEHHHNLADNFASIKVQLKKFANDINLTGPLHNTTNTTINNTTTANTTATNENKNSKFKFFSKSKSNSNNTASNTTANNSCQNNLNNNIKDLNLQTLFNFDVQLKNYVENYSSAGRYPSRNEELNNKIDLEIRILDGILKLLNAICSTPSTGLVSAPVPTSNNSTCNGALSQLNLPSNASLTSASQIINSLDSLKFNDKEKCASIGAAIAAALMSSRSSTTPSSSCAMSSSSSTSSSASTTTCTSTLTSSMSSSSSTLSSSSSSDHINTLGTASSNTTNSKTTNSLFDCNSPEYNHVMQILNACKCLFVSHRKIAIYLQNLNDIEKNSACSSPTKTKTKENGSVLNESTNMLTDSTNIQTASGSYENGKISINTCKLTLSDIRIPLSWKWQDHLKASKNSESINSKFATFAIIYLGNMIYDTQLISNIDASLTDITFNETFVFDDVKPEKFEITIEIYSYELFNTTNNLIQSARKLAKQFTDFATFKRNSHQNTSQNNVLSQMPNLFNNALTNSTNAYSYSMHRFRLIARATLNQNDVSEHIETRCLQLTNDSNVEHHNNIGYHQQPQQQQPMSNFNGSNTISNSSNNVSIISLTNKLPLFDYYSCRLKIIPTSSFI